MSDRVHRVRVDETFDRVPIVVSLFGLRRGDEGLQVVGNSARVNSDFEWEHCVTWTTSVC